MRSATRALISTFGGIVGLIGIEHGLGAVMQGNIAPSGLIFPSWPESVFFSSLGGEPALSVVPNLLATGILAILVSSIYLVWAVWFVERKHSGLVLMLLSAPMLLMGGGIFPPILGFIIGAAATRMHAPLTWWRTHLSAGSRNSLAALWPWFFGACVLTWISMFPGVAVLSYFFGITDTNLIFALLICMFGFLFLTGLAGFARDSKRQAGTAPGA